MTLLVIGSLCCPVEVLSLLWCDFKKVIYLKFLYIHTCLFNVLYWIVLVLFLHDCLCIFYLYIVVFVFFIFTLLSLYFDLAYTNDCIFVLLAQ